MEKQSRVVVHNREITTYSKQCDTMRHFTIVFFCLVLTISVACFRLPVSGAKKQKRQASASKKKEGGLRLYFSSLVLARFFAILTKGLEQAAICANC